MRAGLTALLGDGLDVGKTCRVAGSGVGLVGLPRALSLYFSSELPVLACPSGVLSPSGLHLLSVIYLFNHNCSPPFLRDLPLHYPAPPRIHVCIYTPLVLIVLGVEPKAYTLSYIPSPSKKCFKYF